VSGTSAGHGRNDASFGAHSLTQLSIFQQLSQLGISWINYATTTGSGDALFFSWTESSGAATTNVKPLSQFISDAQSGHLPQFSYINPSCCGVGTK